MKERTLTPKRKAFAVNKAAGLKNREAAISAGYAANNADVQASALLRRADIKALIGATKGDPQGVTIVSVADVMPRKNYTEPMQFQADVMNNSALPLAMRSDAAKQLLPYKHARIGETGKKEKALSRAGEIVAAGRRGDRLTPKAPSPSLRIVTGGKDS